ncbi:MAG: CHASE3 domain-containing protein [Candidatus Obscuribacter sp.]|nr:CHASE3 domain-containing protein [Candidatus Obscuribacter sp.]MBK9280840.1 CHASE3 domain-containing protein [Candidatus Obscuribacter sp.]
MKVILPLLVFILTFASAVSHYFLFEQWKAEREALYEQVKIRAVNTQITALSKLFYDAAVAMGGYSITKNDLFSERFNKIIKEIPADLKELRALEESDRVALKKIDAIEVTINDGMKLLMESKKAIDDNTIDVANVRKRHSFQKIRAFADQLKEQLKELQQEPNDSSIRTQGRRTLTLLLIGFALNFASLLLLTIHMALLSRSKRT